MQKQAPKLPVTSAAAPVRNGAMVVLMAILLPVLILMSAFAINLAYMELTRTQAFTAADAATRAAGRTYSLTGDLSKAKARAEEAASRNLIAGKAAKIAASDFILGTSTRASTANRYSFAAGGTHPNALKVTVSRLASGPNGAVPLLFPGILGKSTYEVSRTAVSTRVEVDLAFVVDRSGSMAYASDETASYPPLPAAAPPGWFFGDSAPTPSRWRDLVAGANAFLVELDNSVLYEYVSLVTYGDSATVDRSMTSNYDVIRTGIKTYTDNFPSGKTNIGAGINLGLGSLGSGMARSSASKVIVVMTDGIRTPGLGPDPVAVARAAAEKGIIVFTVTFSDEADQAGMKLVADAGSGLHFHARNAAALKAVLENIVRILPTILTQ